MFKKIWPDVWSPRMEYILNNCILALLEYPESTLLGINRMLSDKIYREEVVNNVSDPAVKSFGQTSLQNIQTNFQLKPAPPFKTKWGNSFPILLSETLLDSQNLLLTSESLWTARKYC